MMSKSKAALRVFGAVAGLIVIGMTGSLPVVRAQESAPVSAVPLAEIADVARLEKAVKAAHGKVVLVNFWASWNAPSAGIYPAFVLLYDRYHAEGLEVISVSTDPTAQREGRVIPFILNNRTKFPTFLKADGDIAAFLAAVDVNWTGTLPRTYVLGRDGHLRQIIPTARISASRFEAQIRKLLKEELPKPKRGDKPTDTSTPQKRSPNGFLGGA